MPEFQAPYQGRVVEIDGTYTGKNINATDGSRTAFASDLSIGHALQLDPYDHEHASGSKEYGKVYATPTTGQKGPIAILVNANLGAINKQTVSGTRDGGTVTLADRGSTVQAIVYANATAGTTTLAPDTSGRLIATDESEPAKRVGNTAVACAVALETADTSSTAALKWVRLY